MQKIFLETNDEKLINKAKAGLPDFEVIQLGSNKELSRLEHLREASYGSVLYSNTQFKSPMFSNRVDLFTLVHAKKALEYASNKLLATPSGLLSKYVGGIQTLPTNVIVFANTKKWEEDVESLLNVLPDEWWTTAGFLAVNNADKLSALYTDVFFYSTFLAGDKSSLAKLSNSETDFVDITHLGRDVDAGRWVRELTRRPEMWEVRDPDTEFKREV